MSSSPDNNNLLSISGADTEFGKGRGVGARGLNPRICLPDLGQFRGFFDNLGQTWVGWIRSCIYIRLRPSLGFHSTVFNVRDIGEIGARLQTKKYFYIFLISYLYSYYSFLFLTFIVFIELIVMLHLH